MKIIRTIRTHWKKSIFFTGLSISGAVYGYARYKESLLLRQYCMRMQHHSLEKVTSDAKIKEIVVFLNPSSGNRKGAKTFNKFALPMLNTSGINFVIVPTSYEGHVSSLLKYLPAETEAVVVAGGDGMLQDTVTALLRNKKHSHLPVGFIPLGTHNTFCSRYLSDTDSLSNVDAICQSVINIVEGNVQKLPIMEISPAKGKTIFATSYFTWGSVKGAMDFIPKFWWTGGLRTMCAMTRYCLSTTWPCNINLSLNNSVRELASVTVLFPPGAATETGLLLHTQSAQRERYQFLKHVGLKINGNRHSGLLTQLTLGDPLGKPHFREISVVPLCEGKFFVDGESVDSRTINIKYLTDTLRVFVPRVPIPAECANVIPPLPHSLSQIIQSFYQFVGFT